MKTQRPASGKRPSQRTGNGHAEVASDAPTNGHSTEGVILNNTGTLPVRAANGKHKSLSDSSVAVTYAPTTELDTRELDVVEAIQSDAPSGPRSWLTLETGFYLIIFLAAMITRFWGLDVKGLHHDESLHAVFSWRYYVDQGYIHSPMMHGPEQFHFIDFFYMLFGATDATARFASAFCGVFIVMAPLLLRRQIGRWPALIASFLFFISPGFMYFTRFAREDSIYAAMEILFLVGLWRFIDERRPRDFYVACAGFALMFTIKETAYITAAVLGVLLIGLFTWQIGRWLFLTFIAYGIAVGGMAVLILKMEGTPKLPSIPSQDPTPQNIQDFVNGLIAHPLIQVSAGITLLWLAVSGYMLWDQSRRIRAAALEELATAEPTQEELDDRAVALSESLQYEPVATRAENGEWDAATDGNGHLSGEEADDLEEYAPQTPAPGRARVRDARRVQPQPVAAYAVPGMLERYQAGSLPYAIGYLLRNPEVLGIGLGLAVLIYVALFTSMFSNINGLGTGMFGSIGYWIAQHDVRRGDQPWFYYILLIPIYDILAVFFGFVAMALFSVVGIRSLLRRHREEPTEPDVTVPGATAGFNVGKRVEFADFRPFAILFQAFWFVGVFGLYSWAGEKMPWLMIHMVQPLIFLTAILLGRIVTSMIRHRRERIEDYEVLDGAADGAGPARKLVAAPVAPWTSWSKPGSYVPFVSFVIVFALLAALWAMNITARVADENYDNWWQLLVWPAMMLVVFAGYWSWVGGGRAVRYLAVGLLAVLLVYTGRSAFNLSFINQDTPRELAVYVQTAPDVTRMVDTVDRLSIDQTGAKDLKVMYDSQTSWPMEWYFRDYKNKIFNSAGPTTAPADDVAVLVVDSKFYDQVQAQTAPWLSNYVATKYVMRWWFPEETYRQFVPDRFDKIAEDGTRSKEPVGQATGFFSTIFYTLGAPAEQAKLWKFLIWRQPYAALGSTDMAVFVRKDLYNRYNFLASLNLPDYGQMAR